MRICLVLHCRRKNNRQTSWGTLSPGCTRLVCLVLQVGTSSTNCFSTKRCHGILMATDGHSFCFMSYLSPPTLEAPPQQHHAPLGTGWGESELRWVRAASSTPLLPVAQPGFSFPNTEHVGSMQIWCSWATENCRWMSNKIVLVHLLKNIPNPCPQGLWGTY